jgi:ATP-dependent protease ClpP protease subunit
MSNDADDEPKPAAVAPANEPPAASPSKTPMFTAMHAQRYQRQLLIRQLESDTKRKLLCFVSGHAGQVSRDDTAGFVDMLHNVSSGEPVDLLLHTPGGDIDAAEKLITLLRTTVGEGGSLRVIVPDFAKSAGTLMALGANSIVMSDSSELGTIDPQIWLKDGKGNDICHSVLNYIDAYDELAAALRSDPNDPVARAMFDKFDPTTLRKFKSVRDRARTFAENQLKRRGANFSKIASELMDTRQFPSHGQMIGWEAAQRIGLTIDYMERTDAVWRRYWELYCHLRLAVSSSDDQKIFESSYVSLVFDS